MSTKNDMNTSVTVVCYKYKTLSNGESPLMLQICRDGKRKFKSIGVSMDKNHWDFPKHRPKPNCPNGELIQKIILVKITDMGTVLMNHLVAIVAKKLFLFRRLAILRIFPSLRKLMVH